jgi:hypothetical protein
MSGDHAKREIKTGDKPASLGKAPSRGSCNKAKEGSPPSIKSHRSGDKKKKMNKVVYYETDSSSPSTSCSEASVASRRHERKSIVRCPFPIPVFLSALLYFLFP